MAQPGSNDKLNILPGAAAVIELTLAEETALANKVFPANIIIKKASTGQFYACDGVTTISNINVPINYQDPITFYRIRTTAEAVAAEKAAQEESGTYTDILDTATNAVWSYDTENTVWVNKGNISYVVGDNIIIYDSTIPSLMYLHNGELVELSASTAESIIKALGYTPADYDQLIPLSKPEINTLCDETLIDNPAEEEESLGDESMGEETPEEEVNP